MAADHELFQEAQTQWDIEKLYADLAIAKQEIAPHKQPSLTPVERELLRGLLCRYSPTEIAAQRFTAPKTVEVSLSNTLYRYIEVLTYSLPIGFGNVMAISASYVGSPFPPRITRFQPFYPLVPGTQASNSKV